MTEIHDNELGNALRDLDVPEHRPDFEASLERQLRRRPNRRTWALAAAATLAAAAIVALVVPRGSDVASAAQVRDAIADALASAGRVSGVFVNREAGGENRWSFVLDSSGSFRITGLGKNNPTDLAYDSKTNVESWSDLGLFVRRTGLAPGWPDSSAAGWVVQRGLGSVVAALAASPDADVEEVDYAGRAAWQLRTPTGNPGEERVITVDKGTGIPVRDARLRNGRPAGEWRIEQLQVDNDPAGMSFTLQRKPDQQPTAYDMGFRRASPDEIAGMVGYDVSVPSWVPDGYELDETAFARSSRPTGDEQHQNPPSRNVVSLRYRRGLDELVITTRATGPDPSRWGDPVVGSSVRAAPPKRIDFGSPAWLVVDPNSVPHIWAVRGPYVVTIAGNVDSDELLRIADSMRR
jgi:hypothetical protein